VAKFVRRAVGAAGVIREQASAAGVNWVAAHPAIWEYLTLAEDDSGDVRETSMLCVFVEDGLVKMALQDRQEGQSLWVSSASLVEAFAALERRLVDGTGEWRQSRHAAKARGGKKR